MAGSCHSLSLRTFMYIKLKRCSAIEIIHWNSFIVAIMTIAVAFVNRCVWKGRWNAMWLPQRKAACARSPVINDCRMRVFPRPTHHLAPVGLHCRNLPVATVHCIESLYSDISTSYLCYKKVRNQNVFIFLIFWICPVYRTYPVVLLFFNNLLGVYYYNYDSFSICAWDIVILDQRGIRTSRVSYSPVDRL